MQITRNVRADRIKVGDRFTYRGSAERIATSVETGPTSTTILWDRAETAGASGENSEPGVDFGEIGANRYDEEFTVLTAPEIGMGASLLYPQDTYGYVVTDTGKGGKWVHLFRLDFERLPEADRKPVRFEGPWPVFAHEFTDAERADLRLRGSDGRAYLRKDGYYYLAGTRIILGKAVYYRNHSY